MRTSTQNKLRSPQTQTSPGPRAPPASPHRGRPSWCQGPRVPHCGHGAFAPGALCSQVGITLPLPCWAPVVCSSGLVWGPGHVCTRPAKRCPLHTESSRVSGQRCHQMRPPGFSPLCTGRVQGWPRSPSSLPEEPHVLTERSVLAGLALPGCGPQPSHLSRLRTPRIPPDFGRELKAVPGTRSGDCSAGKLPSMGPGSELPVTTPLRSVGTWPVPRGEGGEGRERL